MAEIALDLFRDSPAPGPFSRRGAVRTSADAAVAIETRVTALQRGVLIQLESGPLTADECAVLMDRHFMTIRPRFAELHKAGLIEPAGADRPSALGSPQAVHRITDAGRKVLG